MQKYFLTVLFIVYAVTGFAQYSFKAKLVDELQQPIEGVTVILGKSLKVATTDVYGYFSFNFSAQQFLLSFSHVGFITRQVKVNMLLPEKITMFHYNELLDETVVKAFERNSTTQNTAAAVTVLSKNSLQRLGTQSLLAAVNTVPGVKMDERSPGSYRLSIRGNLLRSTFGVRNVKVYWKGIPFTDANGNTYLNQLSPNNISRMEIIKGPSGSMYGSGTGGVVLLSSGAAVTAKQSYVEVQAAAGSYGLFAGNIAFQQTGKNQTGLSISHQQSDGYRNHTNMKRDVAHYSGSYALSDRKRFNANIFYSDLYYQTPGGLTRAELNANPKQARPAAGIFQSAATQKAAIYLKTIYAGLAQEMTINSRWNNTTGVYGSYTDFKNPTIRNYEDKYEKGLGARSVFQFKSGILTGTFGGEIQLGYFNSGVFGNRAGTKDTLLFKAAIQSRQYNVFAQTDIELPHHFLLNAGISYNNFYYGYKRTSDVNREKESSHFTPQLIPRVSLIKKLDLLSVYVAVSKGYSVPTIDEVNAGNDIFNTSLKAETAVNYEAGIKGDLIKNKLWLDAAYYFLSLKNTIVSRRDAGGGDFYTNAGKTKQRGAELSVHYLPVNNIDKYIRQFKLSSSFTNINATFDNYQQGIIKYDGNQLTGTPPNVFVINADIVYAGGVYINTSFSYTDHIPLNDANTFYAPSYWLYFVKLGYKTTLGSSTETNFFISSERSPKNPYSLGNDLNAAANRFFNPAAPQLLSIGFSCRFKVK
jgi:iron complex outermembrane recepter protein